MYLDRRRFVRTNVVHLFYIDGINYKIMFVACGTSMQINR